MADETKKINRRKKWRSPTPEEKHCTIVVRVREFSKIRVYSIEDKSCLGFVDYEVSGDDFKDDYYNVSVYPNGIDIMSEGWVSVNFTKCYVVGKKSVYRARHVELTSVIAIIDAEGNRRFTQTFGTCHDSIPSAPDHNPNLLIDRYVSRSVLLGEPSEWLPKDTLTLHIDAVLKQSYYYSLDDDFRVEGPDWSPRGLQCHLRLDSVLARILAEESDYFQRLPLTPMAEKRSGWVRIPHDEYENFKTIGRLLVDGGPVTFDSLRGILELYSTADKYGILAVMEDCRSWLKLCLHLEDADEISEFADKHSGDESLRTIVESLASPDGDAQPTVAGEEWIFIKREPVGAGPRLEFRLKNEEDGAAEQNDAFDFYI